MKHREEWRDLYKERITGGAKHRSREPKTTSTDATDRFKVPRPQDSEVCIPHVGSTPFPYNTTHRPPLHFVLWKRLEEQGEEEQGDKEEAAAEPGVGVGVYLYW